MQTDLMTILVEGVRALELEITPLQQQQVLLYLQLLLKWNRVYNLSALRTPEEILVRHILDSLAVIAPLQRHTQGKPICVLDVGSGAGLPGVMIAVMCPEINVLCVDAVAKKTAFVRQVAGSLALNNLRACHTRVEELRDVFDVVISRAFSSLVDFCTLSVQTLAVNGVWLAMKGKQPEVEIAALPPEVEMFHMEQVHVPGLRAERCLVWMRRA